MMNKPENTKPFDLAHAMAGAPIVQRNGEPLRFVAYTKEADPSCCVVVIERNQLIGTRRKSGLVNEFGVLDNPRDAFMAPLGLIDGKPVFVGDEFVFAGGPLIAAPHTRDFLGCTWPAPAKVYPVTQMSPEQIVAIRMRTGTTIVEDTIEIANAAIRHAIDAGQVVVPYESWLGIGTAVIYGSAADIARVDKLLDEPRASPARDMAIAKAVGNECRRAVNDSTLHYGRISNINLANVIANVTAEGK